MFARETYIQRRERLRAQVQSGLILLLGNEESPMNYAANTYPFRQDSTFLYFFGLDQPGLAAVIDVEEGTECVFGDDPTVEEIVWTGPVPLLRARCERTSGLKVAPNWQKPRKTSHCPKGQPKQPAFSAVPCRATY